MNLALKNANDLTDILQGIGVSFSDENVDLDESEEYIEVNMFEKVDPLQDLINVIEGKDELKPEEEDNSELSRMEKLLSGWGPV